VDRGVVLTEVGRFGLEEIEVEPPGPDEVLVRLEASGVCHTDLHVAETGWAHRLPVLLGHEGAGVVEEVGAGVDATSYRQVVYSRAWSSYGTHTLKLVVVGTAGRPRGELDAFEIVR
jgi:Zn-dependent alcohol dehydrogenase